MAQKGRRTKAGDRTRTAVLEATLRLLGRDGPDAFSGSSLAKETGVSKATLFHHFGSIEGIQLAAFEQSWRQSLGPNTRKLVSARDYLKNLGRQVIASVEEDGELLRAQVVFVTKAVFDTRLRKHLATQAVQMHRAVVQELSARLPQRFPASEIDLIARMAEMTLDGLLIAIVMRKGSRELADTEVVWTGFVELLLSRAGVG